MRKGCWEFLPIFCCIAAEAVRDSLPASKSFVTKKGQVNILVSCFGIGTPHIGTPRDQSSWVAARMQQGRSLKQDLENSITIIYIYIM